MKKINQNKLIRNLILILGLVCSLNVFAAGNLCEGLFSKSSAEKTENVNQTYELGLGINGLTETAFLKAKSAKDLFDNLIKLLEQGELDLKELDINNWDGDPQKTSRMGPAIIAVLKAFDKNPNISDSAEYTAMLFKELKSILEWVQDGDPIDYALINKSLIQSDGLVKNIAVSEHKKYVTAFIKALRKIPALNGIVFRGTTISSEVLQQFKDKASTSYRFPGFLASSLSINKALGFIDFAFQRNPNNTRMPVLMIIKSKSAKMTSIGTDFLPEQEVLFNPNTNFKVINVLEIPNPDKQSKKKIIHALILEEDN